MIKRAVIIKASSCPIWVMECSECARLGCHIEPKCGPIAYTADTRNFRIRRY